MTNLVYWSSHFINAITIIIYDMFDISLVVGVSAFIYINTYTHIRSISCPLA